MKKDTLLKRIPLAAVFSLFYICSFANTTTILVQNFSFDPSTITVNVGDTIIWQWVNGTHTTTSLTIPSGATAWDDPMTSSNTTFQYVIMEAGTYAYQCTPHAPNMAGEFIALDPSGISKLNINVPFAYAYPNPFVDKISLSFSAKGLEKVSIHNLIGKEFRCYAIPTNELRIELDLSDLPAGIYFYTTMIKGEMIETKKIVKMKL